MASTAQEGGDVGQVEDSAREEHFEYPARGLRNDQGARVFPRKLCNPTYISRLSTMRFNKAMKQFTGVQLGHIRKYKMEALLHMPYHLIIPMNLLEWLDHHIFGNVEPYFNHKYKVIKITKDMVDKIFDFPGGTVPFVFSSDDPQVKSEVAELRTKDVSVIPSLNFGQLALDFMREELEHHFEMIMSRPTVEEMNKPSHIGGCLPIWGIIYLDFVDFDVIENHQSTVDYSLPQISHIKNDDFQYLALVDRNYESRKAFGVLPIRDISQTPYATVGPVNNAPINPTEFVSVPHVEVINVSNVPEDIFGTTQLIQRVQQSIQKIRVEQATNTLFVDLDGFPVSYENYYNSFKARGEIGDEVMNSFIQVLNYESKLSSDVKPFIKKYCFTSYFTNKLFVTPETFDPVSCEREFNRINSEESLWKQDLLYFPTIRSSTWVILCISSLFEETHFFDPCGTMLETAQKELVHNLVSNLNMLCKLSKKPFKNVFNFKLEATGPNPTKCLMHDSGHYLPVYMEKFEGKSMKFFSAENIPKYRMICAFKFFKSALNKLKEEDLQPSN